MTTLVCVCVCVCVRACVRVCVRACVRARARTHTHLCVSHMPDNVCVFVYNTVFTCIVMCLREVFSSLIQRVYWHWCVERIFYCILCPLLLNN